MAEQGEGGLSKLKNSIRTAFDNQKSAFQNQESPIQKGGLVGTIPPSFGIENYEIPFYLQDSDGWGSLYFKDHTPKPVDHPDYADPDNPYKPYLGYKYSNRDKLNIKYASGQTSQGFRRESLISMLIGNGLKFINDNNDSDVNVNNLIRMGKEPYIVSEMPEEDNDFFGTGRALNAGNRDLPILHAVTHAVRLAKFMTSIDGLIFIGKQEILRKRGDFGGKIGKAFTSALGLGESAGPQKYRGNYNPLSTIGSAFGMGRFGGRDLFGFTRQDPSFKEILPLDELLSEYPNFNPMDVPNPAIAMVALGQGGSPLRSKLVSSVTGKATRRNVTTALRGISSVLNPRYGWLFGGTRAVTRKTNLGTTTFATYPYFADESGNQLSVRVAYAEEHAGIITGSLGSSFSLQKDQNSATTFKNLDLKSYKEFTDQMETMITDQVPSKHYAYRDSSADDLFDWGKTSPNKADDISGTFSGISGSNMLGDKMTLQPIFPGLDFADAQEQAVARGETIVGGLEELKKDLMPFYFKDLRDNSYIYFRAYIEGLSENISPSYASHNYMGRSEPVYVYERAEREITFTLKIFAQTKEELEPIYTKLDKLTSLCYPEYRNDEYGNRMKPPLTRFRYGELFGKRDHELMGFIKSLSYNIDPAAPYEIEVGKRVPTHINATIGYQVIHDKVPNLETKFYGINK